jgi:predicted Zn-dependent protease
MLSGCANKTGDQSNKIPSGPVDVWLIPMEGVAAEYVSSVQDRLTRETGLTVRATVEAGKSPDMYNTASRQIVSEKIVEAYKDMPERLKPSTPKTAYIILTADDLNQEDRKLRFVFMTTFPAQRMGVISMARMKDNLNGALVVPTRTKERLYKMAKKAVGILYYGYSRSSDRHSVMFSPVMGLEDLDQVGTDWK